MESGHPGCYSKQGRPLQSRQRLTLLVKRGRHAQVGERPRLGEHLSFGDVESGDRPNS